MQSRRSKQEVRDGSQTSSANGRLDVLLQMWDLLRQNQSESPSLNPEVTNLIFVITCNSSAFQLLEVITDTRSFFGAVLFKSHKKVTITCIRDWDYD